ncbi:glutathione S-transferase/GST-like protein [Dongia mobilis]|uniref:Glutathione S-transferase/GST-like protein n=1 Tax=Dongia mobilis TaxID=578943 RepID=A0A4R6WRU5_9PROT|nr:glutathione S-transferase family protein [Dongia mobilis]TDQ81323.1 glutathione S-transferase/GST-like protein [Dongia mobilis]
MSLTFYYGSGSPYAWKVWLALEHKGIPHEAKRLSFDNDDTKTPQFLAVNPRGRVPAILDDGFAIWESAAILEYLEERYPQNPLLPTDIHGRATVRRLVAEADNYLSPASGELIEQAVYLSPAERDPEKSRAACQRMGDELRRFEDYLKGEFLHESLSLADFAAFPYIRLAQRADERAPGLGIARADMPAGIRAWMDRIEALPYYARTIPPHWKS